MNTPHNLSELALLILKAMRRPMTVAQCCQRVRREDSTVRKCILRLVDKGLMVESGKDAGAKVFMTTTAGLEVYRASRPTEPMLADVHQGPQVYSTLLNAPASGEIRSIKNMADYVPPKHYIRPEAAQAAALKSRGLGC